MYVLHIHEIFFLIHMFMSLFTKNYEVYFYAMISYYHTCNRRMESCKDYVILVLVVERPPGK